MDAETGQNDSGHGARAPLTSTRLLLRIRDQEDPDAWRAFVSQYGPRLLGFFRAKGLRREDAEELTQDVFVRISQRIKIFREHKGSARNWIFKIASNIWIDALRKWQSKPKFEAIKAIEPKEVAAEFTGEYLDRVADEALERTELRLLEEKPRNGARDYRIFRRNWRDRVSRKEIAAQENMSEAAVGMVILRVLARFKEEVEELIGDLP